MNTAFLGATKNYQNGSGTNSFSVTKLAGANCYVIHCTNENAGGISVTSVTIGALNAVKLAGVTSPGRNEVWIYLGTIPDGASTVTVTWASSATSIVAVKQYSNVCSYSSAYTASGDSSSTSVSLTALEVYDGIIDCCHANYSTSGVTPGAGQTEDYEHNEGYQTSQGSHKTKTTTSETMTNTIAASRAWSEIALVLYDTPPGRNFAVPVFIGM